MEVFDPHLGVVGGVCTPIPIPNLYDFMKVRPTVDRDRLAELIKTLPASIQPEWIDRLDLHDVVAVKPVPKIYFAIGVARCGKSTYGRRWWVGGEMPEIDGPRVVWNSDSLRMVHTGERFVKETEPFVHLVKTLAVASHVENGATVFVDGTHTTEESIKDLLKIDIDAEPILFSGTAKETCIERAYATGQDDLVPVIHRQYFQMIAMLADGVDALMEKLRDQVRDFQEYRWGKRGN